MFWRSMSDISVLDMHCIMMMMMMMMIGLDEQALSLHSIAFCRSKYSVII